MFHEHGNAFLAILAYLTATRTEKYVIVTYFLQQPAVQIRTEFLNRLL